MKHYGSCLLLGVICFLAAQTLVSAAERCDEPKSPEQVRIYFANGMNNKPAEIRESRAALETLVGTSANRSVGKSVNTHEGFLRDLLEAASQGS